MAQQEKFTQDELMQLFGAALGGAPAPAPAAAPPPPAPVAPVAPPVPPPAPVAPVAPPPAPPPVQPAMTAPQPPPVAPMAAAPAPLAVQPVMTAPQPPPPPPTVAAPPSPPMSPPTAPAAPAAPVAPNAPVAGAPPPPIPAETLQAVDDLGHQFEIGRVRMEQVLTPFIGDKVTKKMLAWSLERAQKNHPILKNVHWSPTNDLLDNGEIEVGRLVKNLELFPGQPQLQMVKMALADLLIMRLAAVEQGLGPSMKQAVEKEVARLAEILK